MESRRLVYPTSLIDISLLLPTFFLVLCRISGMMITAPLFGGATIPDRLKAAVVLVVSAATFPMLAPALPRALTLSQVLTGLAGELLIGLLMGMGLSLILLATQMTGMIVGQQAGLALAGAFDPGTEIESSVGGQIYFLTATAVFLLVGGHREILRGVLDSFQSIPVMAFQSHSSMITLLTDLMMSALALALRMAAPMMIALLLANLCLGFLSRTLPQLHILSVGFAVFAVIGILLSGTQIGPAHDVLLDYLAETIEAIRGVLGVP